MNRSLILVIIVIIVSVGVLLYSTGKKYQSHLEQEQHEQRERTLRFAVQTHRSSFTSTTPIDAVVALYGDGDDDSTLD